MEARAGEGGHRRATAVRVATWAAWLLGAPGAAQQAGINVRAYEFWIAIPDTGTEITGTAAIRFARLARSDDTLRLDLVGLTVDSVRDEHSGRALPFTHDGRMLRIAIGAPPDPQDADKEGVVVGYHGIPRDGLVMRQNARGRRSVFADNWPARARYWLPTVDHPSDKASVRFYVGVPDGWRVVAAGHDGGCGRRRSDGRWFCEWLQAMPIPTYTMVIGAGEFAVSERRPIMHGRDTIPIEVWSYLEDSAYADSVPFRRATEIVEGMEKLVGTFPYEKLAHVESSTRFGGMENSSAIFYAEQPYVERRMREGVVRHETAHQWFGDAVTERAWHHLWLSEGFASYFDWVIGAALDGDSVLRNGMRASAESYFKSSVVDRPIIDTAEHDLMRLLNANSYQKGSWVLHMLRSQIGDSAFWRGIRGYYRKYRDSTALSEDFQGVMEQASGEKLDWFFRQWLYQPGYPQLDATWMYEASTGRVALNLTQVQPAGWGLFRLPRVAVDFVGPGSSVTRRTVALVGRRLTVSLDVHAPPVDVRIDPGGELLVRANVRRRAG